MTTQQAEKKNYKTTLNLPQTAFPMEAKLTANEPARLARWKQAGLYQQLMARRAGSKRWILHDGPPFANGDIHIGHLINKTLKDVIIRFRSMQGLQAPYIPGWDCHGLPIEQKIQDDLGSKFRELSPTQVRERCAAYAQKYVDLQSTQFQRLGILGDWEHPYVTMSPAYEASQLEVFARFVEAGLVVRKLRPVPWSVSNQTALAEHELEYKDVEDPSIFVEFPATDRAKTAAAFGQTGTTPVYFLIWTTTPWTLPANLAISVNPTHQYSLVRYTRAGETRLAVVAAELVEKTFANRDGVSDHAVVATIPGTRLLDANLTYRHAFIDRQGKLLSAMYVTTTDGTGLVHTAPGHGVEDYGAGVAAGLPPYSPVLPNGRFDTTAPEFIQGKSVWEANPLVIEKLRENGLLFDLKKILHSYPHDWRSKKPVIQRAAEQWFIAVDKPFTFEEEPKENPRTLRERAVDAVKNQAEFIPQWGAHRLLGMLEGREDWGISRQRAWGLPIPVFYNKQGQALLTPESVRAVAEQFEKHGSNAWFDLSPAELLGPNFRYPPGFSPNELTREQDTFDVGFDSGTSWNAVLRGNHGLGFPSDLYLEGSDQHRLWFQLSLLASLGATGAPPFRQVLTHGFAVKPDGTKVSKSDKEYVTATQEINKHGADLLRLWCCSVDYQNDIPTSPATIQEFGDKYRKIRNTLRYLLSNLYDFKPHEHTQEIPASSLDGWASSALDQLIREVTAAYDTYQLHRAFRLLHDFCAVEISAIYGNAMKDRLYCELPGSPIRRRSQTVMYRMADTLTRLLAPMIVFTADEAWEIIQHKSEADGFSVHLALLSEPAAPPASEEQQAEWKLLLNLRDQATAQLDALKKSAGLNKASESEVVYKIGNAMLREKLRGYGVDLEDLIGAGFHTFDESATGGVTEVTVLDRRQTYKACARSWKRRPDVGSDPDYPDLSKRDAAAIKAL
jgi:isoleucyl-tRNA synthetase